MASFVVDSNVPFIATGQIGEAWAVVILEEIAKGKISACTTVLYEQELLDVYYSQGEKFKSKKMFRAFRKVVNKSLSATPEDFDRSYELFLENKKLSPRELMSAAIMERNDINKIFSLDGPTYGDIQFVEIIRLPTFLKNLGIDGDYVYERFRNSQRIFS